MGRHVIKNDELLANINEAIECHEKKIKQSIIMKKSSVNKEFWDQCQRVAVTSISALKVLKGTIEVGLEVKK